MELRYLGFEQRQNARDYRFDAVEKGQPARRFVVTADLALFRTLGVVIQEGPTLCASKLLSDLESDSGGAHELTAQDLRAYVTARSTADAKRAESRKAPRRRPNPNADGSAAAPAPFRF
jgi:hypothetical protein